MIELGALAAIVAGVWFWLDALKAREIALQAGENACRAEGVQFLDWTVAQERLRLRRNEEGRVQWLRVYHFEFSETGNDRLDGSVTLHGRSVASVRLAPRPVYGENVVPLR